MRPVLLEMFGFASFREHTVVRFDDVDYFALVGPTGAGKSTVIDALAFALYGTVARWDKENMVAPALAPTANRGVVRLIFDVSGARYSALRELRRSGGKNPTVGVKNARLERFADPSALGDPDDVTESLAADSEVTPAVELLLGLSFKQFCTCVALPQGDFAEFLHVKAGDRQKILIKLLGLEVYDRIARGAGAEASRQQDRADTLTSQLGLYADATEEAATGLSDRVQQLEKLSAHVEATLPDLDKLASEHARATGRVSALADEIDQLAAVRLPDGIADLEQARLAAATGLLAASAEVSAAEGATRAARAALAAAPARGVLEQTRRHWSELQAVTAAIPTLTQAAEQAELNAARAVKDRDANSKALPGLRDRRDELTQRGREARQHVTAAQAELSLLTAVSEPTGILELGERHAAATAAAAAAAADVELTEGAVAASRMRLDAAVDAGMLATTTDRARRLVQLLSADQAASTDRAEAEKSLQDAIEQHTRARLALTTAETALRAAEQADAAITLRSALAVGEDCPVCQQPVHQLPHPGAAADLDSARKRLAEADTDHAAATTALTTAQRVADRAADAHAQALRGAETLRTGLTADLTGRTGLAAAKPLTTTLAATATDKTVQRLLHATTTLADRLDEMARDRDQLVRTVGEAEAALDDARAAAKSTGAELDNLEQDVRAARAALRAAREEVLSLRPPAIDDEDVRSGWQQLMTWAKQHSKDRAAELSGRTAAALAAEQEAAVAVDAVLAAEATALSLQDLATAAALSAQAAATDLDSAQRRLAELRSTLVDGLSDDDAAAALARVTSLEADVKRAERASDEAQRQRDAAAIAQQQVGEQVTDSRRLLARTRDPLARLGAPMHDGPDLLAAWTELLTWTTRQLTARQQELDAARASANSTRDQLRELESELRDRAAGNGVELADQDARSLRERLPVTVATSLTQAREQQARMRERLDQSADLRAGVDQATAASQVARKLADLMRADQFPRWLVASALDVLVTEASAVLSELSGGQFELSHAGGDFVVIDHNEADAIRPVKTLSGGETFQASLALALALSSHMSSLAAAGAARLDSIFLDEGFGTLDESTLDTVAATLENLAMSGSRMVGLVTHVRALADRVPVRFQVRRDVSGSHITREAP